MDSHCGVRSISAPRLKHARTSSYMGPSGTPLWQPLVFARLSALTAAPLTSEEPPPARFLPSQLPFSLPSRPTFPHRQRLD